jgi:hypothetical protein
MVKIEPKNETFKAKIDRAIARAKRERLFVGPNRTAQRCYKVENRTKGTAYTVNFFIRNGAKFAGCDCKAGAEGLVCKHVAVALGCHIQRVALGLVKQMPAVSAAR